MELQNKTWQELIDEATPGLKAFLSTRLSQSSDVDDCLQTVLLKAIEFSDRVTPASRKAWLFRVAANESARLWREKAATQKMHEKRSQDHLASQDQPPPEPLDHLIQDETITQVQQGLKQLPESTQSIIRMKLVSNLTFEQIAAELQIPLGTALTRMRRGLAKIKRFVDGDPGEDSSTP